MRSVCFVYVFLWETHENDKKRIKIRFFNKFILSIYVLAIYTHPSCFCNVMCVFVLFELNNVVGRPYTFIFLEKYKNNVKCVVK